MFIGEILPGPIIGTVLHVARLPKDWIVLFSANLPHGVWRVPGSHKTRASVTHRGYITPALYQQEWPGVKIKDATDLVRLPLNLEFGGIQVFQLKQGHIIYVAPKRHGQKQHILSKIKLASQVLPVSTGVPGDRESVASWPSLPNPLWPCPGVPRLSSAIGAGNQEDFLMGPRQMPYVGDQHHLQLVSGERLGAGDRMVEPDPAGAAGHLHLPRLKRSRPTQEERYSPSPFALHIFASQNYMRTD